MRCTLPTQNSWTHCIPSVGGGQISLRCMHESLEVKHNRFSPLKYRKLTRVAPHSIVSTISHEQHRQRRSALSSFFSTVSVHKFEPTMKAHIKKMMVRLDSSACTKSVVNIHNIFNATTSDIITHYAFGKSFNYLDMPDYGQAYFEATRQFLLLTHICVLIPWVYPVIQSSPGWLLRIMLPALREIRDRQDVSCTIHLGVHSRCLFLGLNSVVDESD